MLNVIKTIAKTKLFLHSITFLIVNLTIIVIYNINIASKCSMTCIWTYMDLHGL